MVEIKGKIHDLNNQPLVGIIIEAFERSVFSNLDRILAPAEVSDSTGSFTIVPVSNIQPDIQKIYIVITDTNKKYSSVKDGQSRFNKVIDFQGNVKWKSESLDDIGNIDITISLQPRKLPDNKYEALVIGSGFGGTITSLTLATKYKEDGAGKKVCILERGQWWVSHEMPLNEKGTTDGKPTIREYLEKNDIPYSTWAYPDDFKGVFRVFGNSKPVNKVRGLYDYRAMRNVHVITASGVGGGSLVYTNVTERPDKSVYETWPTEADGKPTLGEYFKVAEDFIGVNSITTTDGLGKFKLRRAQIFQDAANTIDPNSIANVVRRNPDGTPMLDKNRKPIFDFDARLSITEVPNGVFNPDIQNKHPTEEEIAKYSKQNNVCQRQGRCVLGCIPGARHTLNKQIHKAISDDKPLDIFPLCEVINIEESGDPEFKYKIDFKDYRDNDAGIKRTIQATLVILAAGTLGSTEILLKCRKLQLSKKLGQRFSTNGDLLGVINPTKEIVDASRGPVTTSIARFRNANTGKFAFSIEDEGIPKMFAEVFATLFDEMAWTKGNSLVPNKNLIDRFNEIIIGKINNTETMNWLLKLIEGLDLSSSNILTSKIIEIITDVRRLTLDDKRRAQSPEERVYHILMLGGIGIDDPKAQLVLDNNSNRLNLKDPYDLNQPVFNNIVNAMKLLAKEIGRNAENSLTIPFWDTVNKTQFVLHPLGGCPMGEDATTGVVNSFGEVFKGQSGKSVYEHLYVVDGSIVPSPLGVNPSLTISALAFRIAEQIAGDKKYWP
jgi:choline dehydrogenase-like flavoprotein